MAIREGLCQSLNTSAFVLESLQRARRIDGRVLTEMRSLRFSFTRAEGQASAEVQLGRTRALAVVSSEVVPPYPDRPADGLLSFSVELSKMAEASIGAQRSSPIAAEIVRIIERGVRDSQALVSAQTTLDLQLLFMVVQLSLVLLLRHCVSCLY
jgi:exosome complex component RRP45